MENKIARKALDKSRDAALVIDSKGKILYWNRAAHKIFGYQADETIGKFIFDIIVSDQYYEDFKSIFINIDTAIENFLFDETLELFAKNRSGRQFPIELKMAELDLEDIRLIGCYVRDVTDKIDFEEEQTKLVEELQISKDLIEANASELLEANVKLGESEERLLELNASKDKFFSIIAHDLRGPFQGLLGYSEILKKDIAKLNEQQISDFAAGLHESALKVFKLMDNLLQWSRIQRGVMKFVPERLDLMQITDINFDIVQLKANEKNIHLINKLKDKYFASADFNLVNTVFRNLLNNALKFTEENGFISVDCERIENEGKLLICIEDSGVGMDEETRKNLFRIESAKSTHGTAGEEGSGLGLILCAEMLEITGQKIEVESTPENGSKFCFTLDEYTGEDN